MQEILNDEGKLFFVIVSIVMVVNFCVGLFLFLRTKKFVDNAVKISANIVNVEEARGGNGGKFYNVEIEYKDRMGRPFKGKVCSNTLVKEGEHFEVLYDKDNPEKVKANNKLQLYIMSIAMMSSIVTFGIVLFLTYQNGFTKLPF